MSTKWLNHADPHINALLAPDGPLAAPSDENQPGELLSDEQPSAGGTVASRWVVEFLDGVR